MSKNQDQSVSEGAVAIQAARDVNIHRHGLELAEVRELVDIFLYSQLPALRAEAAAIARKNAEIYLEEFVARLAKPNNATAEAFAKPDTQACFNTALQGSAEKGDQIDISLLAETVLLRLESDGETLLKLVCEEAVTALTKMGRQHVAFLAFVQYTKYVHHASAVDLSQLEYFAQTVLPVVTPGFELSEPNQEYLAGLGVLNINRVANVNQFTTNLLQNHPFLSNSLLQIEANAPTLHLLIQKSNSNGIPMSYLTLSGKLIGILALKKVFPTVNLGIWIH